MELAVEECHCVCFPGNGLDIRTPRNEYLSAFFKRSYANHTVKVRMPVILTKIIDNLVRNRVRIVTMHGSETVNELKYVLRELSKLKYEIQTNKEIIPLTSTEPDALHYNKILKYHRDKNETCSYFNVLWLFAECYMYRRIRQMFETTVNLNKFDPFLEDKRNNFYKTTPVMITMARFMLNILNTKLRINSKDFKMFLRVSLWSNQCDLSHSQGEITPVTAYIENKEKLTKNLLCDMSEEVWEAVIVESRYEFVDVVLDNCGYELFTDLCLADFLITRNIAERVRFYVKTMPWFVSDVTKHDLEWFVDECENSNNDVLKNIGIRWKTYFEDDIWTIEVHDFWTTPYEFKHMFAVDEDLYRKLARAKLIIFKGDLNYRKLFGEKFWDPAARIENCLEGFFPTRICSLRILKSETVCGLTNNVVERAEMQDPTWMTSGDYAVIQYCGNNLELQ